MCVFTDLHSLITNGFFFPTQCVVRCSGKLKFRFQAGDCASDCESVSESDSQPDAAPDAASLVHKKKKLSDTLQFVSLSIFPYR